MLEDGLHGKGNPAPGGRVSPGAGNDFDTADELQMDKRLAGRPETHAGPGR
jgi:hypothetical protein